MKEVYLLAVKSSQTRTGLIADIMEVTAPFKVKILDVAQSEIHDMLSLGMLIEVARDDSQKLFKELVFLSHRMSIQVTFTPVSLPNYEAMVNMQKTSRFTVTVLTRSLSAKHFFLVGKVVADNGLNIDQILRLSDLYSLTRVNMANARSAFQLHVSGLPSQCERMREDLYRISMEEPVDLAVQEDDLFRRNRRLILFDMDSTLIQCEVIDELAKVAGVGEQVAAITESAMRGEIGFRESFHQRIALLKGMPETVLNGIADNLPITEGAPRLISNLKKLGYKVGILSGGFTYFAHRLQKELGIDYVHANELDFVDGRLSGKVKGEIVDGERKALLLKQIAAENGFSLKQVIAVGDGANDIPMLKLAGLGVAFHAKPKVKKQAKVAVNTLGLDGILYLLGIRDSESLVGTHNSTSLPETPVPVFSKL